MTDPVNETNQLKRPFSMAKIPAARKSSVDPLKTIAGALVAAFKGAKGGTADAQAAAGKAVPAAGRLLTQAVYTTAYTFSYGLVFPAVMIAHSIPTNNALVQGLKNGAHAASDTVDQWKHRQLEPSVKPAPSHPSKPRRAHARSSKAKIMAR
jgi:hypothetical protein